MRIRVSSLAIASVMVAIALVASTALAPMKQFPWHVFFAIIAPAVVVGYAWMGAAHNSSDGPGARAAVLILSVILWYFLIEAVRRWWPRRQS